MNVEKIKNWLNLESGDWVDNKTLKRIIQDAYRVAGIKQTAKASDILFFYQAKKHQKRENGVQINGYKIL